MNRVEKYKKARQYKKVCVLSLLLFFLFLAAGVYVADSSTNYLLNDKKGIEIVAFKADHPHYEIIMMNQKIDINVMYIDRDCQKLKQFIRQKYLSAMHFFNLN